MKKNNTQVSPESQILKNLAKLEGYYGAKYLTELIYHPNQPIHVTRLRNLFNLPVHSSPEFDSIRADDLPYSANPNPEQPIERADSIAVKQVKERLLSILDMIDSAREDNDLSRLDELYDERDMLTDWLRQTINIHNRIKKLSDRTAIDYLAVYKNVRKIIDLIAELDPALARHIREHLSTGKCFVWRE